VKTGGKTCLLLLLLAACAGRVVEPLIAASTVFVGVENAVRRGEPGWRRALALAPRLVHGFVCAGALKEA
jgi:hypothetical protein